MCSGLVKAAGVVGYLRHHKVQITLGEVISSPRYNGLESDVSVSCTTYRMVIIEQFE